MSRVARITAGGFCYHVINRGNRRERVFHSTEDYDTFVLFMDKASVHMRMRILAFCLMPNHFHLVLWPYGDGDMSRWMHWLMTAHVVRYHKKYGTTGRIWQGRYKSFPIEQDEHLLTVLRYVERNPVRANLVSRAADWKWSSANQYHRELQQSLLTEPPTPRPDDWIDFVDQPQSSAELDALRRCSFKCSPYGTAAWVRYAADRLCLQSSLRGPGRPK
ncbi:MAG: transposase [Gammaproteobacteria bacterium]|nr:transposase [Gammaproteobacteria bacterium]